MNSEGTWKPYCHACLPPLLLPLPLTATASRLEGPDPVPPCSSHYDLPMNRPEDTMVCRSTEFCNYTSFMFQPTESLCLL
ncbi:hypothetical protein BZA05DRAFT_399198 [Tricharina praecox]|uniref:uncharacterized protein n=1 Tax=Tricharina praecox TaxID=43433 RepID=UPI00221F0378|nr:uncharacterized protein BZA05DRAFT_399198 [Tricharina praecox]KAI5850924.1 hypothetical protein BZA05DRAFT_399198 [Tricharina praecox]